ncbi:MAG: molybdenum cofactor biosynthesis protein MoaE [Planctomycetota bacterium]
MSDDLARKTAPPSPWILTGLEDRPVAAIDLPTIDSCGGECVFLGRTRGETHPDHGPLLRLDYEAYAPMVEKLLDQLARDVADAHGCASVRLVHAVGPVAVGEASVVVQTLAGHRAEAFAACRQAIDRLKAELPIWKREIWENGQTFVDGAVVTTPIG